MQDGDHVRPGEDRPELEGELRRVGGGGKLPAVARDVRDPFHGAVVPENQADAARPYGVEWDYGHDHAVGGLHDVPNPAELLCGALAACEDGLIRMLAGALGIELRHLEVEVTGDVDVRGTLGLDPDVRVGFQSMGMTVRLRVPPDTPPRLVERLRIGAEQLCVNLDTLRNGVPVETSYEVGTGADA